MSGTFPQWERGAPYWVWMLCCLHTTLLAILAVGSGLFGLGAVAEGAPPGNVLLAVALTTLVALLMAGLTRAWRLGRAWSWWVLTVLSALGCGYALLEVLLAGPGPGAAFGMAVNTLFLVLLVRPSSRAWVARPADDRLPSAAP